MRLWYDILTKLLQRAATRTLIIEQWKTLKIQEKDSQAQSAWKSSVTEKPHGFEVSVIENKIQEPIHVRNVSTQKQ